MGTYLMHNWKYSYSENLSMMSIKTSRKGLCDMKKRNAAGILGPSCKKVMTKACSVRDVRRKWKCGASTPLE